MKFLFGILLMGFSAVHAADEFEKAIQIPVERYVLKNGLVVILHEDRNIPEISLNTWFRVGSKDEKVGRTGLAHFFEHMMFKGTAKYPKDTYGKFLNSKGAELNAFTSNDYTGYYINIPSEHLELALDIESDRMRNLLLDPKEVNSEREVVKEERRMRYEDNIQGGVREKMAEVLYKSLPYRWLPIGSMADLNAASMDDLHAFYKTYYSPGNAVLVLAGDFKSENAKKLIDKYYSKIAKEEVPPVIAVPEKEQTEVRKAVIERVAQTPTLAVAYPLPDMKHPDFYALDLLSVALGDGDSSRLYKRLVYRDEIAMGVGAYSYGQVLAGSFQFHVQLKPGVNPDKALAKLEEELNKVRNSKLSAKELEKARNTFFQSRVDSLKRVAGRAQLLAEYEVLFGDYKRIFTELSNYKKVTAEEIQNVAKKYLVSQKKNVVVVMPKKGGA